MSNLKLANMSNGLMFPHDDICYFQSCWGHHCSYGYFRIDAMPLRAIRHLLTGGTIEIIDATAKNKSLTDGQKYGVGTWCLVFNRAIRMYNPVCSWVTPEMKRVASSNLHKPTVKTIRKLLGIYGHIKPVSIGDNIIITCYKNVTFDDNKLLQKELVRQL